MKIIKENSPYIHKASSVKRMMIDVLIALIPVLAFAIIEFGINALWVILTSVLVMILAEFVFCLLTKQDPYNGEKKTFKSFFQTPIKKMTINNILAPSISGIIYALILPALSFSGKNFYIVVIGALFGIVIGKLVFGGLGGNIFNPAAVGRVFVMIAFGAGIKYATTIHHLGGIDIFAGGTPLTLLNESSIYTWDAIKTLFVGTVSGSMGEVSKVAIILGGIYLFVRRSADFRPTLAFILTFAIIMLFAGIAVPNVNPGMYMLYNLLSGGLLFGAIFMVTDPITSPTTGPGRITYGVLIGVIVSFIRLFGAYPEGVAFAILIANMFVPVIDYHRFSSSKYSYKKIIIWALLLIISCLIVVFRA